MELILGLVTGLLIGLTGTGGGVLLTPLLLILTPLPATVIIGTSLLLGAVTKAAGAIVHLRLGHVNGRLALLLIAGSVPGALGGVLLIQKIQSTYLASQLDSFLRWVLALTLLGVAILLPFVGRIRKKNIQRSNNLPAPDTGRKAQFVALGAGVGFMVALTSVGSGSLMMAFLLLMVPLPIARLVGTDIFFGLAATVVAGSLHLWMGHFDGGLFAKLAIGAVPGVIVGSRMTRWLPEVSFRWLFSVLYFSLAARLLVG